MEVVRICLNLYLFAVISRHSSFAADNEDACNKFTHEERMLEKMIGIEYKVKEMDREMAKTHGALLSLLESQNRRIDEICDRRNTESANVPLVAFSAYNPVDKNPSTGEIFIFGNAQLNEGNKYNAETGVFTAPIDGLYQFSAHICNKHGKFIVSAIVCNEIELAVSSQWDDTGSCGSVTALANVKTGEKVSVKCRHCQAGAEIYENYDRRNSFTGVLLQKK